MKRIEKEIQRVEKVVTFEAIDGQIFKSEEECKAYEKSIKGTITEMWANLIKVRGDGMDCLIGNDTGCECLVYIVTLTSEQDVNVLNRYLEITDAYNFNKHRANYDAVGTDVVVSVGECNDWSLYLGEVKEYMSKMTKGLNKLLNELHSTETE